MSYQHNAMGQRVSKTSSQHQEYYHYDLAGQLMAVTDQSGNVIQEYIYLGSQLVGVVNVERDPNAPTSPNPSDCTGYCQLIPGQIEAEDYTAYSDSDPANNGWSYREDGVDIEPSEDTGGGYNVGYTAAGEWLEYSFFAQSAGDYTIDLRVAAEYAGAQVQLSIDGTTVTTIESLPATGDWQTWTTVTYNVGHISEGLHTLRVNIINGGFNVNWVNFNNVNPDAPENNPDAPGDTALLFVYSDHLGTPQMLADANQVIHWEIERQTPFGEVVFNDDVDGDGTSVVFNIRFAGQYWDDETGTSYNYFRTYDPALGRYVQSDPIGLNGGINTYGYVGGNPQKYIDPLGLSGMDWSARYRASEEWAGSTEKSIEAQQEGFKYADFVLGVIPFAAAAKFLQCGSKVTKSGGQKLLPAPKPKPPKGNANNAPENGTIFVDSKGNAIVTPPGGRITGSPDGRFIQARDASGNPTGVRIDGPHSPRTHNDPRALEPHGHVPGVTNADGTPWLPINQ